MSGSSDLLKPNKRVDGATVNKRFNRAIKANGGSKQAYEDAAIAETRTLFDSTPRELYRRTGGDQKLGRRSLPEPVQEAYMVNESVCANELERQVGSLGGESQGEVDGRIVGHVEGQTRENRRRGLFKW